MNKDFKSFQSDPDKVIVSNKYFTSNKNDAVKLRFFNDDEKNYPPMSLYTMMKDTCNSNPSHPAHVTYKGEIVETMTYRDYWVKCLKLSKSLIKMELEYLECVSIYGSNSSNYLVAELGTIFASGVFCGYPPRSSLDWIRQSIIDSKSKIIFVHNTFFLEKLLQIQSIIGFDFKLIIQMYDDLDFKYKKIKNIISWNDFISLGDIISDEALDKKIQLIAPNKCAVIMYTSGTTGQPKAAMHSHDNYTYTARSRFRDYLGLQMYNERIISKFIQSHIAGQMNDLAMPICVGATLFFLEPNNENILIEKFNTIKPTYFYSFTNTWWSFKKIYEEKNGILGLDNCKNIFTGGLHTPTELIQFFRDHNVNLRQIYASTELNRYSSQNLSDPIDSVGKVNHTDTRIGNQNELIANGRTVFMGYMNSEEKNNEVFDNKGLFHVFDSIKIDIDGHLFIRGRLSDMIKTTDSNFVMTTYIENEIKSNLSDFVKNCMIAGEGKEYLIALVTLKSKISENGDSLDELEDSVVNKLKLFDVYYTKQSQFALSLPENHELLKYFCLKVDDAYKKWCIFDGYLDDLSTIKKVKILSRDFSEKFDELTATLKLRRKSILKNFEMEINNCYNEPSIIS